ncbi:MAG: helix-turn-helix domain-containing protein [Rhodovibrio sp.]|nr:helix-turn-helix domain-containing protein [Rhodovibrio sp.]
MLGQRLRQRRVRVGLSQEKLARMVGITFQQVQKYERGANRIVASRLYELARVLDVPVSYFFDDLSAKAANDIANQNVGPHEATQDSTAHDVMAERETLELVRAYYSIDDEEGAPPGVRPAALGSRSRRATTDPGVPATERACDRAGLRSWRGLRSAGFGLAASPSGRTQRTSCLIRVRTTPSTASLQASGGVVRIGLARDAVSLRSRFARRPARPDRLCNMQTDPDARPPSWLNAGR